MAGQTLVLVRVAPVLGPCCRWPCKPDTALPQGSLRRQPLPPLVFDITVRRLLVNRKDYPRIHLQGTLAGLNNNVVEVNLSPETYSICSKVYGGGGGGVWGGGGGRGGDGGHRHITIPRPERRCAAKVAGGVARTTTNDVVLPLAAA